MKESCDDCEYRKWYGEYSLYYCEKSGRVVEQNDCCDIQKESDGNI